MQKQTGRLLQKLTRDKILEYFPVLTEDDVRSTSMGAGGSDIQLSQAAKRLVPFEIECKNKREIAVYGWYEQAKEHGPLEPILVIKQDRCDPLVVIDADYFFNLIRKING